MIPKHTLTSLMSPSIMPLPLLYLETLGNGRAQLKIASCCHISFLYITHFDIRNNPQKKFKPHTRTHHVVVIVILAMLTLCYSIMSHATLVLYYHAFMLTLHASLMSCALAVTTYMILGRLECIYIAICHIFFRTRMNILLSIEVKILVLTKWSYRPPLFPIMLTTKHRMVSILWARKAISFNKHMFFLVHILRSTPPPHATHI